MAAAAVLVVAGIITFKNMPIEAFPDVTNTEISIITQWPGRSAEEVEKFVTIWIVLQWPPLNLPLIKGEKGFSIRKEF